MVKKNISNSLQPLKMTAFSRLISYKKKNILVLGSNGMLGYDVYNKLIKLSINNTSGIGTVIGIDASDGIDLSDKNSLVKFMDMSIHFDYCINCVAHTNTSAAQNTKDGCISSYRLNALASKFIAHACLIHKTKLIHISTDYVYSEYSLFDTKVSNNDIGSIMLPISSGKSDEFTNEFPVNTYGVHKLLGEMMIKDVFHSRIKDYTILRTSWLYGVHNNKSFVHKFLGNVKKCIIEGKEIEMTANEFSVPTSTDFLVRCIIDVIESERYGILNGVCKSDIGVSRVQFANTILNLLPSSFVVNNIHLNEVTVKPVERDVFQPMFSALATDFESITDWKDELNMFIASNSDNLKKIIE